MNKKQISPCIKKANPLLEEYTLLDISIILIGTESCGNMGAVARIMKNFSLNNLILFNPQDNPNQSYAKGFAMHGSDILDKAITIVPVKGNEIPELKSLLQNFNVVIGTSAKGYSYQNIKRIPIFLEDLDLTILKQKTKIAIIFGRESTGLTNDEILLMDFLVKISANPEYPTLNLSHSVGIVLHYIYQNIRQINHIQVIPATKKDKDDLLNQIKIVLEKIPLQSYRYDRIFHAFKNIFGRAFLTKKEKSLIYTFFKKTKLVLEKSDLLDFTHKE